MVFTAEAAIGPGFRVPELSLSGSHCMTGHVVKKLTVATSRITQDAYNAGHWRAGHSLALMAESGVKGSSNCTEAESYIREFIAERFTWVQMLNQAQSYHDQGNASSSDPLPDSAVAAVVRSLLSCPNDGLHLHQLCHTPAAMLRLCPNGVDLVHDAHQCM